MTDLDHLRALIAQLEQDANRCTQPSIEANIREAAATLGVFKEREAALFHGRLPEWDESLAPDPEGVRALIAKTEGWTWREAEANPEIAADLIRQLASALTAFLSRTVGAAEEWEYARRRHDTNTIHQMPRKLAERLNAQGTSGEDNGGPGDLLRRHPAGPWEPVPSTPEAPDMSPDHPLPGNVSTSGPETNTTDEEAAHGG